jgi:hypothetical protein
MVAPPAVVRSPELPAEVAGTADITLFVPRAPLPFAAPANPPARHAPAPPTEPWVPPPGSGTEDITSFVPRAAMPFVGAPDVRAPAAPPSAAAAPHPNMRLIRFDPQTGQPLPEPRWVELPPEAPGGGRAKP